MAKLRILIISDTHGDQGAVERILEQVGRIDAVIHAGDVLGGRGLGRFFMGRQKTQASLDPFAQFLAGLPNFTAVHGNCDNPLAGRAEGIDLSQGLRLVKLEATKFLIHHGHKHRFEELLQKAKDLGADVVVSGHSHRKELFKTQGILFINPGSPSLPRDGVESYGLFESAKLYLVNLNTGQIIADKELAGPDDF